jgi:hypothetical protein
VNEVVNGHPAAVTFCPLCNSAMVLDGRADGQTLTIGVSGPLRNSDMIMNDHRSEDWWRQAKNRAIVEQLAGQEMTHIPTGMDSWTAIRNAHPDGLGMDEYDWGQAHGANPYSNYDSSPLFLYSGKNPPQGVDPLEHVVRLDDRASPLTRLRREKRVAEAGATLTCSEGQASELDSAEIGRSRELGNIWIRDGLGRDVLHDIPFAFAFDAFNIETAGG